MRQLWDSQWLKKLKDNSSYLSPFCSLHIWMYACMNTSSVFGLLMCPFACRVQCVTVMAVQSAAVWASSALVVSLINGLDRLLSPRATSHTLHLPEFSYLPVCLEPETFHPVMLFHSFSTPVQSLGCLSVFLRALDIHPGHNVTTSFFWMTSEENYNIYWNIILGCVCVCVNEQWPYINKRHLVTTLISRRDATLAQQVID